MEVLTGPDGPYPNRRDAGARVYLTIGITATRGARPGVRARPVSGRVRTR